MKKLMITLILFPSLTLNLFSQNFGLVGTEWYYGIEDQFCSSVCEYVHFKSVKDTIIQGQTTFKITQTYVRDVGDTLYLEPLYVYNESDTTFAYSFIKSRFLKLFIFNAIQGDTLILDCPPYSFNSPIPLIDSTYRLVIDTVIQRSIDGVPIKEYQTTGLDGRSFHSEHGSFMDRIGGLDWFFATPSASPTGNVGMIRCYKDADVDTSFTTNACDFLLVTGVSELANNTRFKIYPNPSSNNLVVENLGQQKTDVTIELRNITGKMLITQKVAAFQKTIINTSKVPTGIYFVTVKEKTKTLATQKWVKVE